MPNHLNEAVKHRAIESLAAQAKLPYEEVALLYEHESAELDLAARVKKYLPIFTFRNVQEQLLQRRPA